MRFEAAIQIMTEGASLIEDNPEKAIEKIKKGLINMPTAAEGWYNLGLAYHQSKSINKAIQAYKTAMTCKNAPLNEIRNNLAQDLLLNGNYEEGWDLYEERLIKMRDTLSIYSKIYGEPWKGRNETRQFKKLMIVGEQGFGDTIQFCRLVLLIQEYGYDVQFFCPEPLAALLRTQTGIKNICLGVGGNQKYTLWSPLMSLPKLLSINSKNIPYAEGYVLKDKDLVDEWKIKLKANASKKLVGIHWQGNPEFEKRIYSKGRSIKIENMNELSRLKNVEFISLQKGEESYKRGELKALEFVEGQNEFDKTLDFKITSAVIANCDYVICSDSSIAHLAGSMNIKTYLALSCVPEWRWLSHGSETKWYRNMRIYRQEKWGEWKPVLNEIIEDINRT